MSKVSGSINSYSKVRGNIEKPQTVYVKELVFNDYREFPAIGNETFLYIATDENAIYRFDSKKLVYICVGRETKLDTIQCVIKKED